MKRATIITIYTLPFVVAMWNIAMAFSLMQGGMWLSGLCSLIGAAALPVMAQYLRIKIQGG